MSSHVFNLAVIYDRNSLTSQLDWLILLKFSRNIRSLKKKKLWLTQIKLLYNIKLLRVFNLNTSTIRGDKGSIAVLFTNVRQTELNAHFWAKPRLHFWDITSAWTCLCSYELPGLSCSWGMEIYMQGCTYSNGKLNLINSSVFITKQFFLTLHFQLTKYITVMRDANFVIILMLKLYNQLFSN